MVTRVLKIIPGTMALGLVGNSMKVLPKIKMDKGNFSIKPVKIKSIVKVGVGTMVGIPFIKSTSEIVNEIN